MSLTIADLFTAQPAPIIRAAMVADLLSLGIPADKWKRGGVASSILTIASMAFALMSTLIASLIRGFFLPTSEGNSLKLLARYMYGVAVPEATFASGPVTLTNAGGATHTKAAGEYTCLNTATKTNYTNDAAFILGPLSSVDVNVIAVVAGSAGNAIAEGIDANVTTLLGVTVTNAAALVGTDAPTDEGIRQLCLDSLGARSVRGVRTAYAYAVQVATNSVTNAPVNINRWAISADSHDGTVTVIVASPSGAPSANDVTGVATSVEAIARPEGVTSVITGATASPYVATLTLFVRAPIGMTSDTVKEAVDDALIAFVSTYPIGGVEANDDANPSTPISGLFASGVYGEVGAALAAIGAKLMSAQGAIDLVLTETQVATDAITTVIRLIAPTSGTTVS